MEWATVDLLRHTVATWRDDYRTLLEDLERRPDAAAATQRLHDELAALGLTDVLAGEPGADAWAALAAAAFELAQVAAGTALRLLGHNMAVHLLTAGAHAVPSGWLAVPLYDGPADWAHALAARPHDGGLALTGVWRAVAGWPTALQAVLPLVTDHDEFVLAVFERTDEVAVVPWLGLRSCPLGDLDGAGRVLPAASIIGRGAALRAATERLWSHAEAVVAAIRAGLLKAAYLTAHNYAAQRWQGGRVIVEHSLVQTILATIARECLTADAAWREACAAITTDQPLPPRSLAAVLGAAERLPAMVSDALQLLGGNGYMEEYPQARRFRDAHACLPLLGHPHTRQHALWQQRVL